MKGQWAQWAKNKSKSETTIASQIKERKKVNLRKEGKERVNESSEIAIHCDNWQQRDQIKSLEERIN